MPDPDKIKAALLDSSRDYGHRFGDVVHYLESTGWTHRVKGSHHIFGRKGCPYLLNLQSEKSGKAKAYQIGQVRRVLKLLNL